MLQLWYSVEPVVVVAALFVGGVLVLRDIVRRARSVK